MENTCCAKHEGEKIMPVGSDKRSLSVYLTHDEIKKIKDFEFEKIDKNRSNSIKGRMAINFYEKITEELEGIEDFGENRTPDYIALKIIEQYKARRKEARKHKTY